MNDGKESHKERQVFEVEQEGGRWASQVPQKGKAVKNGTTPRRSATQPRGLIEATMNMIILAKPHKKVKKEDYNE